ncbi:PKD domain protein [Symmachiella dynata]|uniref:beta strand repeat-containing protein n=1 Tax=Symmachiella dynata TaxID=2527995 RepID=UPI00118C694E|nr:PKD domain-containing protein [Symmachiella dynata]QDT49187.1 PKD domain protein [Symmachiella dynata]
MLFRTYWLTRLSVANCLTALRHPRLLDDSTILQPLRLEERRLLDSNPVITALDVTPTVVDEGETVTLSGKFQDAPPGEADHHILINWGDGQTSELTGDFSGSTSGANREFTATHIYQNAPTSGSSQSQYTITVIITDASNGSDTAQTHVSVNNTIPTLADLTITSPVLENDLATVSGRVVAAGRLDTHTVSVNWGDGSAASIIQLAARETTFTATHRYLDDNPTGTPQDIYPVTVSVVDNENSGSQQQLNVTVQNVAPQIITLTTKPDAVEEGSPLVLDGTFSDIGSRDTHTATIDWGDGSSSNVSAGGGIFSGEHTYADSGVYTIAVTLTDDDGGSSTSQINVTIGNSIPTLTDLTITSPVLENGLATVTGRVVDAGIRDTHIVSVNWGDGSAASIIQLAARETTFTATHRYLDDNPTGTPQDIYPVTVSVVDNENSGSQQQLNVTVQNVAPQITSLTTKPDAVEEGSPLVLDGTFNDVGSRDTHTATINWGDGTSSSVAAGGGLFSGEHTYVDSGVYTISVTLTDDDGGSSTSQINVTIGNSIPTLTDLTITSPVLENGLATVTGRVVDAGIRDTHTVSVNWGDGSAASIIHLPARETTFTATHRYLDDNPTGTPQDIYPVTVSVVDNENSGSQQQLAVTVQNVAPQITTLTTKPDAVEEGSPLVLDGTFSDIGSRDTHTATIDWGDGTTSNVAAAGGLFSGEHTYVDSGVYTIAVTLTDDDGGSSTSQINVTIGNAIPTLTDLTITSPIFENGFATVSGRVVDAGSRDTHTVSVNWGDGSAASIIQLAARETTFTATHRYLDDNPTGTPQDIYPVTVSVVDNENSGSQQQLDVTVQNVAPQITTLTTKPESVEEGSPLVLDGTFSDVGSRDTHSATIDWGDGSSSNVSAAGGIFSGEHTYVDSGTYTIAVTLTDDDGGSSTSQINVTIGNAIPTLNDLTITSPIFENGFATVSGRVVDAGIRDTHIVSVNWGDGSQASIIQLAAGETTFTATHRYLDDNPTGTPQDLYPVTISVVDNENSGSQQQLDVTVQNVAPEITTLTTKPDAVEEGSPLVLDGTYSDVGSRDTHTATIDWGDGTTSNVAAAGGLFSGEHTYVDSGVYTIAVTLTDDDGGSSTSQINVTIGNAIPMLADLTITSPIFENDIATVTGRVVDAGSRDTHIVSVNWGDGSAASIIQLAAGETTFTATHRYLDDNPTGTPQDIYPVTVSVVDNENSGSQQQLPVTVQNVAPIIDSAALTAIPEVDAEFVVSGKFSDAGSLDDHTLTVDWGDGSAPSVIQYTGGAQNFIASHVFESEGAFAITATLRDDDGATAVSRFSADVSLETQLIVTEFPQATVANAPSGGYVAGVVIKSSRENITTTVSPNPTTSIPFEGNTSDRPVKAMENRGSQEEVVVIELLSPEGKRIRHQNLPKTILVDLPEYIRKLPDGHYRFYFKTPEAQRLIMDVHVRGGQIIDPGDLLKTQQQNVSQTPTNDGELPAQASALRIDAADQGESTSAHIDHPNWEATVDSAMSKFPESSSQVPWSARRSTSTF